MRKVFFLLVMIALVAGWFVINDHISKKVDRILTAIFNEQYNDVADSFLSESLIRRMDYGHGAKTNADKYPFNETETHERTYPVTYNWFFGAVTTYTYTYDYVGYNDLGEKFKAWDSYSAPVRITLKLINGKWIIVDKQEDP